MFNIYIDADSLPKSHRAIILKRVVKESECIGECVFACDRMLSDVKEAQENHTAALRLPYRERLDKLELRKIKTNIQMVVVPVGANSADDYLVENASKPGFAITHDVPLSNRLVEKGIVVLDDRGNTYTSNNVKERLSDRNFMTALREMGFESEKNKSFDQRTINEFASSLDTIINKYKKEYC